MATYPATNSKEASELLIDGSNQVHELVNGDATTEVITESGLVPSVRKALADTFLFQDPIAWNQGSDETAFNQLRTFNDNIYWAPTATTLNPIPMGVTPIGDSNWKLAPVDVSREWTLDEITAAQNDIVGGKLFKGSNGEVIKNGDVVEPEITHLRTLVDGEPTIVAMSPVTNGVISGLTGGGATIGTTWVSFINVKDHKILLNRNAEGAHNASAINTDFGGNVQDLNDDTSRFSDKLSAMKNLYAPKLYSRFKKARDKCPVNRAYIWKNPNRTGDTQYMFSVGVNQGVNNTAEWDFIADVDGFIRMKYGYTGAIRQSDSFVDATNLSVPITGSAGDNAWFDSDSALNATFEVQFTGVGFLFNHYVDTRGGVFSISIDGGTPIEVSTHSDNPENAEAIYGSISKLIASDLEDTNHTAVFTFIGDDPNYPSTDPVRSKGWFKLPDGVNPETHTATVITGNEMGIGTTNNSLVSNGILEFAILASRTGSGLPPDWCPAHGSSDGALQITDTKIYVDSYLQQSGLPSLTSEKEIKEFTMVQSYLAFNTNEPDFSSPMWEGVITTKFDRLNGLTYSHDLKTLTDVDVVSGYTGMVSGRRTEGLDTVELDNGYEIDISTDTPVTQIEHDGGLAASVCYEGEGTVLAMETANASSSLMLGRNDDTDQKVLITERTDGFVKTYMTFANNYQLTQNTKISSSHRIWLGIK